VNWCKETAVDCFKNHPGLCLEGLSKTCKTHHWGEQVSWPRFVSRNSRLKHKILECQTLTYYWFCECLWPNSYQQLSDIIINQSENCEIHYSYCLNMVSRLLRVQITLVYIILIIIIIIIIISGVGLSPLGTAATSGLLYKPQMRDEGWLWSNWWNEDWQGKPKYSEKTCPSATLSNTNPTRPDPGLKPGRQPATNHLSYGAALLYIFSLNVFVGESVNNNIVLLLSLTVNAYWIVWQYYRFLKINKHWI
jgi:hypothetical protein